VSFHARSRFETADIDVSITRGLNTLSQSDNRRQEVEREVLDLIISEGKIDPSRITPDATLESLEVQSMDTVMIMMAIEEKFGVYIPIDNQIAEAKDLTSFVRSVSAHIVGTHD
jgi:acyl carrier protein